jgi:PDZ domain-containing protein
MRSGRRWWLIFPPLVLIYLAATIYLPFYSLGPGPARAVQPLIRFDDRPRYESRGSFVLTSVRFRHLTALGILRAWLDPDEEVVNQETLFAPGETAEQERERSISQMDQSKVDAAYVVLKEVTRYPDAHGDGVLIEGVVPGCPADGRLFVGDVIHSIGGRDVGDLAQARAAIRAVPPEQDVSFGVTVDGEPRTVSVARASCADEDRPIVGISMVESFPFPITISSGEIGGPSAGLSWALGLYDLLTPGDLTDGRVIAATGQLGPDGTVYPISGVEEKVRAAASAGADVLIVPQRNLAAARSVGDETPRLEAVSSFDDALALLRRGDAA